MEEESEKVGLKLNILKAKIMSSSTITSWEIDGKTMKTVRDFILRAPKSLQMVTAPMKLKMLASWKKSYDQPRQHIRKQRHGTSLMVQWLRLCVPNAEGLGSIPGQGTRSHMTQLRVCMSQLKILSTMTKMHCSQINNK